MSLVPGRPGDYDSPHPAPEFAPWTDLAWLARSPTARTRLSPAEYVEKARREGYSGILFWSFRAEDRASDFSRV